MNLSPTIFPHISTAPCRNRNFHPQPGLALFYSLPAQNLVIGRDLTATLHKEVNVIGRTMNAHPWTIIACMGQRSPKTSEYPTHLTAQRTDMALVSSRHVATRDNGLIWPYALASTCLISSRSAFGTTSEIWPWTMTMTMMMTMLRTCMSSAIP